MLQDVFFPHFCSFSLMLLGGKIKAVFAEAHVCWRHWEMSCTEEQRWQDASLIIFLTHVHWTMFRDSSCTYEALVKVSDDQLVQHSFSVSCICNKLSLKCRVCSANSILLSSVFIQLLPDVSSAYCPCSPVGLLSLEHAPGRGLFLIGHRPSVPTGGDQMLCQNPWSAKIIWLCLSFTDSVI